MAIARIDLESYDETKVKSTVKALAACFNGVANSDARCGIEAILQGAYDLFKLTVENAPAEPITLLPMDENFLRLQFISNAPWKKYSVLSPQDIGEEAEKFLETAERLKIVTRPRADLL